MNSPISGCVPIGVLTLRWGKSGRPLYKMVVVVVVVVVECYCFLLNIIVVAPEPRPSQNHCYLHYFSDVPDNSVRQLHTFAS